MKIERHARIRTNFVKSGFNEKIGHVNKKIRHANEAIQYELLEINNETTMCADKYKQTLSV